MSFVALSDDDNDDDRNGNDWRSRRRMTFYLLHDFFLICWPLLLAGNTMAVFESQLNQRTEVPGNLYLMNIAYNKSIVLPFYSHNHNPFNYLWNGHFSSYDCCAVLFVSCVTYNAAQRITLLLLLHLSIESLSVSVPVPGRWFSSSSAFQHNIWTHWMRFRELKMKLKTYEKGLNNSIHHSFIYL